MHVRRMSPYFLYWECVSVRPELRTLESSPVLKPSLFRTDYHAGKFVLDAAEWNESSVGPVCGFLPTTYISLPIL